MSEVIAFRDGRKLFRVWVCIVVSMVAFAAGAADRFLETGRTAMKIQALVIDGPVKTAGKIPRAEQIAAWLKEMQPK